MFYVSTYLQWSGREILTNVVSLDLPTSHCGRYKLIFSGPNRAAHAVIRMGQGASSSSLLSPEAKEIHPRRQGLITQTLQNQRCERGLPFPHPAKIHGKQG